MHRNRKYSSGKETDRCAFCVQAVHHGWEELEFVLDGMREKIGVHEDGVGRAERRIVLEEEGGGDLGSVQKVMSQ